MKTILNRICYLLIGLIIIFSACDNLFQNNINELDLPEHQPLIAITALISPIDSVPKIFVTKTIGITEAIDYQPLENASVLLYKDDVLYEEFIFDPISKYYLGSNRFNENEGSFTIEVEAPNLNRIFAKQILPTPVLALNTILNIEGGPLVSAYPTDELIVSFQDSPEIENYYQLTIFPVLDYAPLEKGEQFYLESINDNLISLEGGSLIFTDNSQNGQEISVNIYNNSFSYSALLELRVYLSSITKDKYLFLKTFQKYKDNGGDLFSEPIIVHSNIQEGEGIFTVESTVIDTVKL